jgi:hypothetical protein
MRDDAKTDGRDESSVQSSTTVGPDQDRVSWVAHLSVGGATGGATVVGVGSISELLKASAGR